jgi:hypothetical protein
MNLRHTPSIFIELEKLVEPVAPERGSVTRSKPPTDGVLNFCRRLDLSTLLRVIDPRSVRKLDLASNHKQRNRKRVHLTVRRYYCPTRTL